MRNSIPIICSLVLAATSAAAAEHPVSVEMHVHASLSEGTGTMWAETTRAEEVGLGVLWWSDHDNRISYWQMDGAGRFGWENGLSQKAADSGKKLEWEPDSVELLDPVAEAVSSTSYEGQKSLRMAGRAPEGSDFKVAALRYTTSSGYHHRSLLSDVWIHIAIKPPADLYTNKDVLVALRLELSSNLDGDPMMLTWVAGIPAPASTQWDAWRTLPQLQPGQWNVVEIPLSQQAVESFPFGDDNSFRRFFIAVAARNGAPVEAFFDDFQIQVRGVRGQALLDRQRQVIESRYSAKVIQMAGQEITLVGHHLNAFGRSVPLTDYDHMPHDIDSAVAFVHAHGGVVSYNHIFGAGGGTKSPEEARQLTEKNASRLLAHDGYGVDVLEVGYQNRVLPIENHLQVWDALSEKQIFVTGNGVSDDHHSRPYGELVNNMVTWLWVEEPTEENLLQALRAGRAFFGDPVLVGKDVSMDLTTPEGIRMGQVAVTSRSSHRVRAVIEGIKAGWKIKGMVNGKVAGTWTASGTRFDASAPVDTRQDAFVRIEVWTDDGRPVLFSNPIWFLRQAPPGGVPTARLAPEPGSVPTVSDPLRTAPAHEGAP